MERGSLSAAILLIVLACCGNGPEACRAAEPSGWLLACPPAAGGACEPYLPQPGDLVFYAHDSLRSCVFYALAHTGKPYHSGIVVNLPDGRPAILEAGPYDYLHVYLMDALPRMRTHPGAVWVRRLRCAAHRGTIGSLDGLCPGADGQALRGVSPRAGSDAAPRARHAARPGVRQPAHRSSELVLLGVGGRRHGRRRTHRSARPQAEHRLSARFVSRSSVRFETLLGGAAPMDMRTVTRTAPTRDRGVAWSCGRGCTRRRCRG